MMKFNDIYNDPSSIRSSDERPVVSLTEKRKTYVGNNKIKQKISVYHVDGGIIKDERVRCDFAIHTNQTDNLYLIELKGTDYSHALKQIDSSINHLITSNHISTNCIYARIILSKRRNPNMLPTQEKILLQKLKRLNGSFEEGHFKTATIKMKEDII